MRIWIDSVQLSHHTHFIQTHYARIRIKSMQLSHHTHFIQTHYARIRIESVHLNYCANSMKINRSSAFCSNNPPIFFLYFWTTPFVPNLFTDLSCILFWADPNNRVIPIRRLGRRTCLFFIDHLVGTCSDCLLWVCIDRYAYNNRLLTN